MKERSRYALKLPNGRWVSVENESMLYSCKGKSHRLPAHYMSTNVFKVLRVRRMVLKDTPIHRVLKGHVVPEYFNACRIVRV